MSSADFQLAAKSSDIPQGQVKVFTVGGKRVALCNVDGSFFAVADLCTHDDGPLGEGDLVDDQIECPRHGARFDVRTGQVKCLPAVTPIAVYALEMRGDEIWIDTKS